MNKKSNIKSLFTLSLIIVFTISSFGQKTTPNPFNFYQITAGKTDNFNLPTQLVRHYNNKTFVADTLKVLHVYNSNNIEELTINIDLNKETTNNNIIQDLHATSTHIAVLFKNNAYVFDYSGNIISQVGHETNYAVDHPWKFNRARAIYIGNQFLLIRTKNRVTAYNMEDILGDKAPNEILRYAYSNIISSNGGYLTPMRFAEYNNTIYVSDFRTNKIYKFSENDILPNSEFLVKDTGISFNTPYAIDIYENFIGVFGPKQNAVIFDINNPQNSKQLEVGKNSKQFYKKNNAFFYSNPAENNSFNSIKIKNSKITDIPQYSFVEGTDFQLHYQAKIIRYHHNKMFIVDNTNVLHVLENENEILTMDVNLHPENENNNTITDISFNGDYFGILFKNVAYFYDLNGVKKFQIGNPNRGIADNPIQFNRARALLITDNYIYIRTRNRVSVWDLQEALTAIDYKNTFKFTFSSYISAHSSNNNQRNAFAKKGDVIYLTEHAKSKILTFKESDIKKDVKIELTDLALNVTKPEYAAFINEYYGVFSSTDIGRFYDTNNNLTSEKLTENKGTRNYFTTEDYFYYQSLANPNIFKAVAPVKKNIGVYLPNESLSIKKYNQEDLSFYKLLNDKELRSITEQHTIRTNQLIEGVSNEGYIKINNWIPKDYHNVKFTAKMGNYEFELFEIDTLKGLTAYFIPKPWKTKGFLVNAKNVSDNSEVSLDFSQVSEENLNNLKIDFVASDLHLERVKQITTNWKLNFFDYLLSGKANVCGSSVPWNANRTTELSYYLAFMVNTAYTISKQSFQEDWMNTSFTNWSNTISDENRVLQTELDAYSENEKQIWEEFSWNVNDNYIFNKVHRAKTLEKYLNKTFKLGITGGGGLGGGSTLGLNKHKLFDGLFSIDQDHLDLFNQGYRYIPKDSNISSKSNTTWNIFGHEGGHTLGHGHRDSYCVRSAHSHILLGSMYQSHLISTNNMIVLEHEMTNRNLALETNNSGDSNVSPRGKCDTPAEFGGAWGLHNIKLPKGDRNTPEFQEYLQQNKIGKGLEYLKTLSLNNNYYYVSAYQPYEINAYRINEQDLNLNINKDYLFGESNEAKAKSSDVLTVDYYDDFENIEKINVSVFPNPSSRNLQINGVKNIEKISIYDINGKKQNYTRISKNRIDVSSLSSGFYILKVNGKYSAKFQKK